MIVLLLPFISLLINSSFLLSFVKSSYTLEGHLFVYSIIIHSSMLRVSLETFAPIFIVFLPSVANGSA